MKFLFAFTLVLLACLAVSANRLPRDAPKVEEAPKVMENLIAQVQNFVNENFSADKIEEFKNQFQDVITKVSAKGKEMMEQIEAKKETAA